jgi:hypothetical protein
MRSQYANVVSAKSEFNSRCFVLKTSRDQINLQELIFDTRTLHIENASGFKLALFGDSTARQRNDEGSCFTFLGSDSLATRYFVTESADMWILIDYTAFAVPF